MLSLNRPCQPILIQICAVRNRNNPLSREKTTKGCQVQGDIDARLAHKMIHSKAAILIMNKDVKGKYESLRKEKETQLNQQKTRQKKTPSAN